MCFTESSTERSRWLAALRKRKQLSQCTVEAKRARREQEKVQKKKAHCGESSQARYKLCSLFMFISTVVVHELWLISDICSTWPTRIRNAHIRTGTAQREASCACVVLVIIILMNNQQTTFFSACACRCKSSDVNKVYGYLRSGLILNCFSDWITGFQIRLSDFNLDF